MIQEIVDCVGEEPGWPIAIAAVGLISAGAVLGLKAPVYIGSAVVLLMMAGYAVLMVGFIVVSPFVWLWRGAWALRRRKTSSR